MEVSAGRSIQAGLITTNKLTQARNRVEIERAAERGARIRWAVADHVWYDGADGAEVRVAMTVIAKDPPYSTLVVVERLETAHGVVRILDELRVSELNGDLTAHADVAGTASSPLRAAAGLCSQGFKLVGAGFQVEEEHARMMLASEPSLAEVLRPYRNGKDITTRSRNSFLIDFGSRDEAEARRFPVVFDIVRTLVKPERDANPHAQRRKFWWRLGTNSVALRDAVRGLSRYIVTSEVSKHPTFEFLKGDVAPDGSLVCVASEDAAWLGVLSSRLHATWAHAAGGRMGVRHTPRYSKRACFDPFPFPDPSGSLRARIAKVAEHLDAHRKAALARDERVTMTGMYNVVEKLRGGDPLTSKDRIVHEIAACGVLRELHDELDTLVAEAYGWPWPMEKEEILDRLVRLHDERVEEEKRGVVRWLRPDYQIPRFGGDLPGAALELSTTPPPSAAPASEKRPWPSTAVEQLAAIGALVGQRPADVEEVAGAFAGARKDLVVRHLETLALMGEIFLRPDGRYEVARKVA